MLYMVCPTCGYLLGQKVIIYENGKEDICKNPKLTNNDKEQELTKLLLSLNLRRYCCKMRMMSYTDSVKNIIPIPPDE